MNQNYVNDEIEINLIEYIWKLLLQWKPILLAALVAGCLVAGYRYVSDSRSYRAVTAEKSADEVEESLEDEERKAVEDAVKLRKELVELEAYRDTAPIMQVDPYNEEHVSLLYYIVPDGTATLSDLTLISRQYSGYMASKTFYEAYAKGLGLKTDSRYVAELLSISSSFSQTLGNNTVTDEVIMPIITVDALIPADVTSKTVTDTITELLTDYRLETSELSGSYTIRLASAMENTLINNTTNTTQTNAEAAVTTQETAIATATDAFSDAQRNLYNHYLEEEGLLDEADEAEDTESSEVAVAKPSFSIKYFAIGLMVGIVLYAGVLMLIDIFRPRVGRVTDIDALLPQRFAGRIVTERKSGALRSFLYSPLVWRLHYGSNRSVKEQFDEARLNVSFKSRHAQAPEKSVSYLCWNDLTDAHRSLVTSELADAVVALPTDDTDAMYQKLETVENAVLLVEEDKTSMKRLTEMLQLLGENGSEVLAYICLA